LDRRVPYGGVGYAIGESDERFYERVE